MAKKEGSIIQRVLGLDPEEVLQAANAMTVEDIQKLIFRLESITDDLKRNANSEVFEDSLPPKLLGVKDAYQSRIRNNMALLQNGDISKSVFMKDMQNAISNSFTDSYQMGKGAKILSGGDEEWIRRATDQEVGYVSDLADQLMDEDSDIDVDFRSSNYARTLDSVAWNGKIESLDPSTEIHWKLGCLTSNLVRVETARGKIPLYQVNIGDLVLTHKGNWKKVIAKPLTPVSKDHRFAVLIGEGGELIGLTDDHKLWTDEGWLNAKDVFYKKKRVIRFEGRRFQTDKGEGKVLCSLLDGKKVEQCSSVCLGVDESEWRNTGRIFDSSQGSKSVERSDRKFGNSIKRTTQQNTLCWENGERSIKLEGGNEVCVLQKLRERVSILSALERNSEILFPQMRGNLQEEVIKKDFAMWLLWKSIQEGNIQDQEIEIGKVFLFEVVCKSQKWLYDLTVEDDHSFIVEGIPVHNSAEHCEDCILLASQSPFSKDSLPTTPKAGSTTCYTNCKCVLVFKRGKLKPEDALDPSDRERIQGQTLNEFLKPEPPPRGLRIPTDIERGEIDSITNEMNFYRRKIASGELQGEALKDAIKARSRLNASLIDYTEEKGIWDSPLLSVDDVITEAKFPLSAESELFADYGIDGATLDLTTSIKIEKLIGEYEKDYGKKFTDVKKEYKKPEAKKKKKS